MFVNLGGGVVGFEALVRPGDALFVPGHLLHKATTRDLHFVRRNTTDSRVSSHSMDASRPPHRYSTFFHLELILDYYYRRRHARIRSRWHKPLTRSAFESGGRRSSGDVARLHRGRSWCRHLEEAAYLSTSKASGEGRLPSRRATKTRVARDENESHARRDDGPTCCSRRALAPAPARAHARS